jgi:hypothetical protein
MTYYILYTLYILYTEYNNTLYIEHNNTLSTLYTLYTEYNTLNTLVNSAVTVRNSKAAVIKLWFSIGPAAGMYILYTLYTLYTRRENSGLWVRELWMKGG